ncbi:hypothetical protein MPH_05304 [Macrophomina phaseolina MS6]|uniref:Uncharacterized protein n=1 Tax=Macrophomina phaseolina (strain MS6) TaxID=1126212 RepID=K2SL05_MACPH|nr:hypothetical protein MPH_05304 [Macrophomina phaseolina MS6]
MIPPERFADSVIRVADKRTREKTGHDLSGHAHNSDNGQANSMIFSTGLAVAIPGNDTCEKSTQTIVLGTVKLTLPTPLSALIAGYTIWPTHKEQLETRNTHLKRCVPSISFRHLTSISLSSVRGINTSSSGVLNPTTSSGVDASGFYGSQIREKDGV